MIVKCKEIILTLFEGDYNRGVAALINSLVKSEFEGMIIIGYRGGLPSWVTQLKVVDSCHYLVSGSIIIKFELIQTILHFGFYKPFFLLEVLKNYKSIENIYYFDPDITVKAPWNYFTNWVSCGVCLCLDDSFPFVYHNHPWKKHWLGLAKGNFNAINKVDFYVNSGFIGLNKKDKLIIERWINLTTSYINDGGDASKFEKDGYRSIKGDQDLLNAAISITNEIDYSIIGTEGMGFSLPAYLMAHAVYDIKPWNKNFLRALFLRGHKPSTADKYFFNFSSFPIKVFNKYTLKYKQMNLKLASVLSRIIG